MLQYTTIARSDGDKTPGFGLIVRHTDAEREWAYDRQSHFGHFDKALDEAPSRGWLVVDMKTDWEKIYPEVKDGPLTTRQQAKADWTTRPRFLHIWPGNRPRANSPLMPLIATAVCLPG